MADTDAFVGSKNSQNRKHANSSGTTHVIASGGDSGGGSSSIMYGTNTMEDYGGSSIIVPTTSVHIQHHHHIVDFGRCGRGGNEDINQHQEGPPITKFIGYVKKALVDPITKSHMIYQEFIMY